MGFLSANHYYLSCFYLYTSVLTVHSREVSAVNNFVKKISVIVNYLLITSLHLHGYRLSRLCLEDIKYVEYYTKFWLVALRCITV